MRYPDVATPRACWTLAFVCTIAACSRGLTSGDADVRCPAATGEFPPHACAVVRGRAVDRSGRPIPDLGVHVDSFVRERGYAYSSRGTQSGADGRFELTVLRINEFTTPTVPDTATIQIKAVPGAVPAPGSSAVARAAVRMRFAPMGSRVEPTMPQDVVFTLP